MATFIRRALENRQETSVREFSDAMRTAFHKDSVPTVEGQVRALSYSETVDILSSKITSYGYDHQFDEDEHIGSTPVVPATLMQRIRDQNEAVNNAFRERDLGYMVRISKPMLDRPIALVGHMHQFLQDQSAKVQSLMDARIANPGKFDKALDSLTDAERNVVRYAMDTYRAPVVARDEIARMEEGLEDDWEVLDRMEGSGKDAFEVQAKTAELRRADVYVPNANTEFFGEL